MQNKTVSEDKSGAHVPDNHSDASYTAHEWRTIARLADQAAERIPNRSGLWCDGSLYDEYTPGTAYMGRTSVLAIAGLNAAEARAELAETRLRCREEHESIDPASECEIGSYCAMGDRINEATKQANQRAVDALIALAEKALSKASEPTKPPRKKRLTPKEILVAGRDLIRNGKTFTSRRELATAIGCGHSGKGAFGTIVDEAREKGLLTETTNSPTTDAELQLLIDEQATEEWVDEVRSRRAVNRI